MSGNITKEGIRKDLEWMQRIGIGGVQNFDGAINTPQVVEKRLIYMTPEWQDAFRYAVQLAGHLGLEFGISSSPGWSITGGPWVKPEEAMKKLVWSETRVQGNRPFRGTLPEPPSTPGAFQGMRMVETMSHQGFVRPSFYRDVAVIAYRTPAAWRQNPQPVRVTTSADSANRVNGKSLLDGDLTQPISLPLSGAKPAWVLFDYGRPQRFRAASLARPSMSSYTTFTWVLEASDDGQRFRQITAFPSDDFLHHTPHKTIAFPAVETRYLRLTMTPVRLEIGLQFVSAPNAPGAERSHPYGAAPTEVKLAELRFYAGARVHRFEDKAGFSNASDYFSLDGGPSLADETVDPKTLINLTDRMQADGTLHWSPPAGEWTVLRLGYSLTGKVNNAASPEATGLEVDKLDRRAVARYLDRYLEQYERTLDTPLGQQGVHTFVTDSIESRGQNWTPTLIEEFKARRGYDLTPWLPALTGVILESTERTDRFLWDFRKTSRELLSEAHYGQIAESVHQRGLIYYAEALEGAPTMAMGDDLDMRQYADIPMGSMWTSYRRDEYDGAPNNVVDLMGAASVAHVLGRKLVGAEALSSCYEPWAFSPASLRPVIDLAFVLGMNHPVIHTSAHQPVEKSPGMTLGPCGQHFTRHETWAEMAAPWVRYLARTAYLLQQGEPVADVAWFYGEEGPVASLYTRSPPADLPEGYGFDFVNANLLLNHLNARDGKLVSTSGASFRLLYLGGGSRRMTLPVLRKLKELSIRGVTIAGQRPLGSPSLADEGEEGEYRRLVGELWDHGKIIDSRNPNNVLTALGVPRDFDYDKPSPETRVMFLHRKLADGDLYFLTNRNHRVERIEGRFRVTGQRPQLWHADRGEREAVSWRIEKHQMLVPLELHPDQSVFVVFRGATRKTAEQITARQTRRIAQLEGAWELSLEPGRGAPVKPVTTTLGSWTDRTERGIRYFSGIGTYRKRFTLPRGELAHGKGGARVEIDLGQVYELAEVTLNGKLIGTAWHAPFRLDVTDALQPGGNRLEIRVANLWVNRLIGDRQPGATPLAFTVTSTYAPDAPLRPSGLLGPVILIRVTR